MESKTVLLQHFKEAEQRLKEFGSDISSLTNLTALDEGKGQLKHLEDEIQKKIKNRENVLTSQQKEVAELKEELDILSLQQNSFKKHTDLLLDELNHMAEENQQSKLVGTNEEMVALKVKQLETEDEMCRKHLGMEVRKVKGGILQIAFSQIDPKQPKSLFLFSLRLDESRKFVVTECKPNIDDIDTLVDKLNSSNDFHHFFVTVRKRFQDSVTSS